MTDLICENGYSIVQRCAALAFAVVFNNLYVGGREGGILSRKKVSKQLDILGDLECWNATYTGTSAQVQNIALALSFN